MTPKILILKYQSGHGSSITPPSGDGLHQEFSSLLARHKAGRCNSVPYGSIKLILTIGMTLPSLNLIRQEPQVSDMLSLTLSLRSRLTFLDLLAVWPGSLQNFEVFSVACSFAEQVSGYDIIQAADAAGHCRHKTCQITYRWQEIPNTLRPTHDMGHGDGFQILIQQSVAPGKPILMNHWVQERLNVPRNKLSSLLPYSPAQGVRETPRWALELSSLFDEMAFVRNAETGPELDVDVSYNSPRTFPRMHCATSSQIGQPLVC